jgi:poly(3-hydroxybutyrate) depolymerase
MKILVFAALGLGGYWLYRKTQRHAAFSVHTPSGIRHYNVYDPTPAPSTLVVLLHGSGGSTRTLAGRGWERIADQANAVLLFPEGLINITGKRAWNHRFGWAPTTNVDDVGYLAHLITILRQRYPSVRRVIMVGYSNGGFMAYRFASEHGGTLSGLVIMNSTIGQSLPDGSRSFFVPQSPIPVVIFHGGKDNWQGGISPAGEQGSTWQPVAAAVQSYRAANGASRAVQVSNPGVPMVWHQRWTGGAPVEVVIDSHRGHELPRWDWASHAWRAITPG